MSREQNAVQPRGSGAQPAALAATPIQNLRGLLEKSRGQIAMALPKHLTPDRMIRVALTACQKTPELLECDLTSICGAVVQASSLGLELDGVLGHAYLVPFNNRRANKKECQLIVGYRGLIDLAHRSGRVSHFSSHVVYEGDYFDFQYGTEPRCEHRPAMRDRGEPIAVYAAVKLTNGGSDFEVIPWERILEKQQQYAKKGRGGELYGTWVDNLEEMARKTPIRALAKRVPLSPEFHTALNMGEPEPEQNRLGSTVADLALTRTDQVMARIQQRSQEAQQLAGPGTEGDEASAEDHLDPAEVMEREAIQEESEGR